MHSQLPHVAQHLVDDCGLCDDREYPHLPAASRAGEGIDFEDHLTEGNAQPQEPRPARAGLRERGLVLLRELPDRDVAGFEVSVKPPSPTAPFLSLDRNRELQAGRRLVRRGDE